MFLTYKIKKILKDITYVYTFSIQSLIEKYAGSFASNL